MQRYHLYIMNSYNLAYINGQSCASKTVQKKRALHRHRIEGVLCYVVALCDIAATLLES
jgi:hypothetical protein